MTTVATLDRIDQNQKSYSSSSLVERYKRLFNSEKYVDCTFLVDDVKIRCHKLILSAASPVFEAMFYGPLSSSSSSSPSLSPSRKCSSSSSECSSESSTNENHQRDYIEILDISSKIFPILVKFIYTNEANFDNLTLENVFELYYCAEKYLLGDLLKLCLENVQLKLRYENILPALDLSTLMGFKLLKELCFNFFQNVCLKDMFKFKFTITKLIYYHVSKECIENIIADNQMMNLIRLKWFIEKWLQNEQSIHNSNNSSNDDNDCENDENVLILNKVLTPSDNNNHEHNDDATDSYYYYCEKSFDKIFAHKIKSILQSSNKDIRKLTKLSDNGKENTPSREEPGKISNYCANCNSIERTCYKSVRPFIVGQDDFQFVTSIETDRFIYLLAIVMSGRLFPYTPLHTIINRTAPSYNQGKCCLQISTNDGIMIYEESIVQNIMSYNCNTTIFLREQIILSPDTYKIKLTWDTSGTEYLCSLMTSNVQGFKFTDHNSNGTGGGIIRGIKYFELLS